MVPTFNPYYNANNYGFLWDWKDGFYGLNTDKFLESHMFVVYFKFIIGLSFPSGNIIYLCYIKNNCIFIHALFNIKYTTKPDKCKVIKSFFPSLILHYFFMGTVWHSISLFYSSITDTQIPLYFIAFENYNSHEMDALLITIITITEV